MVRDSLSALRARSSNPNLDLWHHLRYLGCPVLLHLFVQQGARLLKFWGISALSVQVPRVPYNPSPEPRFEGIQPCQLHALGSILYTLPFFWPVHLFIVLWVLCAPPCLRAATEWQLPRAGCNFLPTKWLTQRKQKWNFITSFRIWPSPQSWNEKSRFWVFSVMPGRKRPQVAVAARDVQLICPRALWAAFTGMAPWEAQPCQHSWPLCVAFTAVMVLQLQGDWKPRNAGSLLEAGKSSGISVRFGRVWFVFQIQACVYRFHNLHCLHKLSCGSKALY